MIGNRVIVAALCSIALSTIAMGASPWYPLAANTNSGALNYPGLIYGSRLLPC
jgi:hypothetical protein